MVPHGPAAILLFLISLILSCGHLIESFDSVIFIGVLYQLFWFSCVFLTRGNLVEEPRARLSAFSPRWLRLRKTKYNNLRWKMPKKLSDGNFPWQRGPESIMMLHDTSTQFQRTCASFLHFLASFFDRFHLFCNGLLAWLVLVSLLDAVSETSFVFIVGGLFWTICMLTAAALLIRSRTSCRPSRCKKCAGNFLIVYHAYILNYSALLLLGLGVAVEQEPEYTLLARWRIESNQQQATESFCTFREGVADDVSTGSNSDAVAAGALCDVDSAARNIVRQRGPVTPRNQCYRAPVFFHALGPGSPARQGAGHE